MNNRAIIGFYVCVYICIYIHRIQGNMIISNITRKYGEQGYKCHIEEAGYLCRVVRGYINTYTHIHTHVRHTYIYTYTCTCTHIYTYILHMHLHTFVVCVFVCLCVCVSERRHSDCSSVHLPVKLSVCPSVCLGCFFPSVCRFVCLSFHESFYLYFLFYLLLNC